MKHTTITNYEKASHDAVQIKIDNWGKACPKLSVRREGDSLVISVEAESRLYCVYRNVDGILKSIEQIRRPLGYDAEDYVAVHPEFKVEEIYVQEVSS